MPSLDSPTADDRLGFEPYVRGIEDLIRDIRSGDLPCAIGIYGSWGSGKTSFMMQLRARLDAEADNGNSPLPTVWFEAWKYDRAEDVRGALINRILITLEALASGSVKTMIAEKAELFGRVMVGLVARSRLSLGVAGAGVNLASLEEVLEYAKQTAKFHVAVDEFAGAFGEAVNAVLEQTEPAAGRKLVIFIDDLDRCLPENVMTILEALKLFLVES